MFLPIEDNDSVNCVEFSSIGIVPFSGGFTKCRDEVEEITFGGVFCEELDVAGVFVAEFSSSIEFNVFEIVNCISDVVANDVIIAAES